MADINLLQKGDLATSDFSNDNTNNNGGVKVKVSSDAGNLLQKRNNGLYYGIEAPPDTRNLYVSSSTGSDSNKGTRAEPLKTIKEAVDRNNTGTQFTVNIHEDDEHQLLGSWGFFAVDKGVQFRPYGPIFDDVSRRNPVGTYTRWHSKELKRPVIKFVADGSFSYAGKNYETVGMASYNTSSTVIKFYGVTLDLNADADLPIAVFRNALFVTGFSTSFSTELIGCDLVLGSNFYLANIRGVSSIVFDAINIDSSNGNKLLRIEHAANLKLTVFGETNPQETKESVDRTPPGQEPLTRRVYTPVNTLTPYFTGYDAERVIRYTIASNIDLG